MEVLCALFTFIVEKRTVTVASPRKRPVIRIADVIFVASLNELFITNSRWPVVGNAMVLIWRHCNEQDPIVLLSLLMYTPCAYSTAKLEKKTSSNLNIGYVRMEQSGNCNGWYSVKFYLRCNYWVISCNFALVGTSNGSWCIGIKGEISGTVCVTFTWDIYIYMNCL